MKKYLWIPLLGFGLSATAQTGTKTYLLDEAPRYSEETGYGYDLVETPAKDSKSPFFFSVRVPDGNYKVTVRLGSRKQALLLSEQNHAVCSSKAYQPKRKNLLSVLLLSTNGIPTSMATNMYA